MLTQIINGHILTPQGWLKDGSVLISDGKILEVTNSDLAVIGATVIDAKGMYIVPGFVSMHAHGGAGHDFTEGTTELHSTRKFGSSIPSLDAVSFFQKWNVFFWIRVLDIFRHLSPCHFHIEIMSFQMESEYRTVRFTH
jgi:hypothetical protein